MILEYIELMSECYKYRRELFIQPIFQNYVEIPSIFLQFTTEFPL